MKQQHVRLIPYFALCISLFLGLSLSDKKASAQTISPIRSSGLNTRVWSKGKIDSKLARLHLILDRDKKYRLFP